MLMLRYVLSTEPVLWPKKATHGRSKSAHNALIAKTYLWTLCDVACAVTSVVSPCFILDEAIMDLSFFLHPDSYSSAPSFRH